jgi:glucose-1-phosphate thymidylyltransferase
VFYKLKAIILAAGYATRLYPLTTNKPKPLLEIAGKPILEHILEKVKSNKEINEIFIITNARFYDHFRVWSNHFNFPISIKVINDGTLSNDDRLGAVGDINFVLKEEDINDDLLIIGGDNLFEEDLNHFLRYFKNKGSTILLNDVKNEQLATQLGIVTLNDQQRITNFVEKPRYPESTLASTLIYALRKEHLPYFQEVINKGQADRTGDFIAYLAKREPVHGKIMQGRWFDIGNLEALEEANKEFK